MMVRKLFIITLLFTVCACDNLPYVKTPLGEISGSIQTSDSGKKYSAFEGIPFAKPPIGDRRFEKPEPIEPWKGVWNATFLTECAQTSFTDLQISNNAVEDCLHINVYVPREEPNPDEELDVIVHIHGGGYMCGSGHAYAHRLYIMDHDVIFVTFNYRIGILGFLSTEDDVVPGNNGMKDQVLALKWVQDNIASFGGNPESVTLTGLSAGGSSVHLHYFSKLSRGLFHRGFSQSGVATNSFSLQEDALSKAKTVADGVGCPTSCTKAMVECLKQRPFQHLLAQIPKFARYGISPAFPFAPVVEKGSKSGAFLAEDLYFLLKKGDVYDVPWIASNTAHEGALPLFLPFDKLNEIDNKWEEVSAYLLDFSHTVPRDEWKNVATKIREFYVGEDQVFNKAENLPKIISLFSDRLFITDAEDVVRQQSKVVKSPIYYYLFSYPGDHSDNSNVVAHGMDAKYFFSDIFFKKPLSPSELLMKDMMMEMLISFAKDGKPTIEGIEWEPTKADLFTYLNISSVERENNKLQTVENMTPRSFWKSLGMQENENVLLIKDEL